MEPDPRNPTIAARLERILKKAVELGASDLLFDPLFERVRVRVRVDGTLSELESLPIDRLLEIATRLKFMANLDVSEMERPLEGDFARDFDGEVRRFRVSTFPTVTGQHVHIMILAVE